MKYSCVQLYCVIHKNALLLHQHNGDDAPQKLYIVIIRYKQVYLWNTAVCCWDCYCIFYLLLLPNIRRSI